MLIRVHLLLVIAFNISTPIFAFVLPTPRAFQQFPLSIAPRADFEFEFEMPMKGITEYGTAQVKIPPTLESSRIVVVRYSLPFGLDAAPSNGKVVVTKDGKNGELVGDILRQTTCWRGKNPGLFDVSKNADNFNAVVGALTSNDLSVTDEIVLVFERPLP